MIRKTIFFIAVLMMAWGTLTLQAGVEFVFRGNKGYDHYSCGSNRRGGYVRVKSIGNDWFQIFGKRLSGEFEISLNTVDKAWCLGNVGAARIGCGFCKLNKEDQFPFSNLVE